MDNLVVFRIVNLHARSMQHTGLTLQYEGKELFTGPITACLDESVPSSNLALIDFSTGAMAIKWATIVTFPLLADLYSLPDFPPDECGVVRAEFEESGRLTAQGFAVSGPGRIREGSPLSHSIVCSTNGGHIRASRCACEPTEVDHDPNDLSTYRRQLAEGNLVLEFCPELSVIDVTMPQSLGGGHQQFNIKGAFRIEPVLTLHSTVSPAIPTVEDLGSRLMRGEAVFGRTDDPAFRLPPMSTAVV